MKTEPLHLALIVALAAAEACGGAAFQAGDGGADGSSFDGGATDAPSDHGSGSSSGGASESCPTNQLVARGPCTAEGQVCEYGISPAPSCDPQATCTSGQWNLATAGNDPYCTAAPPGDAGGCPGTFMSVPVNDSCPTAVICDYPDGRCACAPPGGGAQGTGNLLWACEQPANCPLPRPRLGTPCPETMNGLSCDYGACTIPGGSTQACTGTLWVPNTQPCPI